MAKYREGNIQAKLVCGSESAIVWKKVIQAEEDSCHSIAHVPGRSDSQDILRSHLTCLVNPDDCSGAFEHRPPKGIAVRISVFISGS